MCAYFCYNCKCFHFLIIDSIRHMQELAQPEPIGRDTPQTKRGLMNDAYRFYLAQMSYF